MGRKQKTPKPTPFTVSRGHLIDALSKPHNSRNRNLKNIADSFDIADDDNDVILNNNDNIRYPNLNQMASSSNTQSPTSSISSPFPKSVIIQNNKLKKMEE